MSVFGGRKVNKKGRSIGSLKLAKRNKIAEPFSAHTITMLESPPFRVLSASGHRIPARLEIELGHHGGQDNGKLPVTFDDFADYGIHRHAVKPAIRECEALGFIEVTQRGRAGNAEFRRPNHFRLTYIYAAGPPPTHEWRKIETMDEAKMRARNARHPRDQKQKSNGGNRTKRSVGNRTTNARFHSAETITTAMVRKPSLLSISPGDESVRREWRTPTLTEYVGVSRAELLSAFKLAN
jgi:hypothetical protein